MMRRASLRALAIVGLVLSAGRILPEDASSGIHAGGDVKAIAKAGGTAIIQTADGTIVVQQIAGIPPEIHQALAKQLGLTEAALTSFFQILEREQVPPEELDSKLREIAKLQKELERKLSTFTSEDPAVVALKEDARVALEAGEFERAELLQNKASARDVEAAKGMQEAAKQRLLSAADSKAENGVLKYTQLAYAEAATYYREAAKLVPEGEELVRSEYLNEEGLRWRDAGQYREATEPIERALSIREEVLGPGHPDVARTLNGLASVYKGLDRYSEAESHMKRALEIDTKALGPEHPDTAKDISNLAILYSEQGREEEAGPLHKRALEIREKVLGPEHPDVATSLNNLAELYYSQGRYAEAAPLYKRALAIVEKTSGAEHPNTLTVRQNYETLLAQIQEASVEGSEN
jgi:tetratricopeptide (TPR) repeat protein